MISTIPAESNDPLLTVPRKSHLVPLTDSVARKHLMLISQCLKLPVPVTFHVFRRAGGSWAFHQGLLIEFIKNHGTWKSDAIHTYLMSTPSLSSPVSRAFVASLYSLFVLGSWVSQLLLLVTYIKFYLVEITVYLAMPILMGHLQNRFTALWLTSPPFCNYNQTDTLSSHWLDGLTFAMAFSPLVFFKLLSP